MWFYIEISLWFKNRLLQKGQRGARNYRKHVHIIQVYVQNLHAWKRWQYLDISLLQHNR